MKNSEALPFRIPMGLFRPVAVKLYLFHTVLIDIYIPHLTCDLEFSIYHVHEHDRFMAKKPAYNGVWHTAVALRDTIKVTPCSYTVGGL
jgi:hypothetical protein